ncbi:hypothetical protein FsymDg_3723 [Candidatus Protofrankia datiscae]|uniref:Uncharacterized protein n=1 Tax=Candidatus Protofrankia datiscae TaxID=2716812 RepID=F8B486_9ACTN|nr:hypothetical protein [Candidatus Protofrankia datiscae]AEH11000.1 hypothetical protein FsymDg_3723 [Candidatus Protofrankia datiscae]
MRRQTRLRPRARWPWLAALALGLFLYAAATAPTTTAADLAVLGHVLSQITAGLGEFIAAL